MAKSIEQLQEEGRILKEAKKGIARERRESVKRAISSTYQRVKQASKKVNVGKAFKSTGRKESRRPSDVTRKVFLSMTGQTTSSKGGAVRPVGRPKGVLKHRSPFTNKPIPATQFYKERRLFRNIQNQKAEQVRQQVIKQYAQKGVTPQQVPLTIQERMRQQFIQQQIQRNQSNQQQVQPQTRQIPQQLQSNAVRPIWRRQNQVRIETDIFGNKREILSGNDPRNFWN